MKKTIVSVDTLNFSLKGENIVIAEKTHLLIPATLRNCKNMFAL